MDDAAKVRKLLRQQAAIARFGSFALTQPDLQEVLTEAARVCAEGLDVPFCKICRYRDAEDDLIVEAGFGWDPGVVGHVLTRADTRSPQGRAFVTREPFICDDLTKDNGFELPSFYAAHGIISTIDVVIKGNDKPYGVLEIDNDKQHDYDSHDIDFLTGFANVLAEAVSTTERTALLRTTIKRMKSLVDEKDRLLSQRRVLADELQHRVRNNLQLVYGMLSKQLDNTADKAGRRGLKAIARRVSTLAQVYDQLLGTEMTRTMDFGAYLKSLCANLAEFQEASEGKVALRCESDVIILDLDVVTALGIVVAELVTNSYEHAFSSKRGSISVSASRTIGTPGMAVMTISDDGSGFEAQIESKRHGLGLVRRLVEEARGTLTMESSKGTIWNISFPVASSTALQSEA